MRVESREADTSRLFSVHLPLARPPGRSLGARLALSGKQVNWITIVTVAVAVAVAFADTVTVTVTVVSSSEAAPFYALIHH